MDLAPFAGTRQSRPDAIREREDNAPGDVPRALIWRDYTIGSGLMLSKT